MDTSTLVYLIFAMAGAFAALLWLRPGKQAAARYALIVLSFGGLLYLLYTHSIPPPPLQTMQIIQLIPLPVFLLGVYMIKSPWRRAVLSLGVYMLVSNLAGFADLFYYWQANVLLPSQIVYRFAVYLAVLWYLIFIWWCTRGDENIRPAERLLAAAAFSLLHNLVVIVINNALSYLPHPPGNTTLSVLISSVIFLLCLAAFLRYVMQQAWKRSLCVTAVAIAISTSIMLVNQHAINSMTVQNNLTEKLIDCIENNDSDGVDACLQQGVDVNKPLREFNQNGELCNFYPLIHATARGRCDMVKALLAAGADVHVRRTGGDTPLLSACIFDGTNDNTELVKLLLQAGSDVNAINDDGCTPLSTATLTEAPQAVIEALLQAGAYVNGKDYKGDTALHGVTMPSEKAYRADAVAIMRLLLTYGAQIDARNQYGETPLLHCAMGGLTEGVRLLLEYGADPDLPDNDGLTPRQHAEENGHPEIAELLSK